MGFFDKAKGKLGVVNKGARQMTHEQWESLPPEQKEAMRLDQAKLRAKGKVNLAYWKQHEKL